MMTIEYDQRKKTIMQQRQLVLFCVLGLAGAGLILYLVFAPNVIIYIDNGSKEPVTVFMDGVQKRVVSPLHFDKIYCRAGTYQLMVKRDGNVVFDQIKLVQSRGNAGYGRYLINPEATNRYRTEVVKYGMSFPSFQTYRTEDERIRLLTGALNLLPASDWIDVAPDHVLESAPSSVQGKYMSERKVLIRAPFADAELILTTLARWEKENKAAFAPENMDEKVASFKLFEEQMQAREGEYQLVKAAVERIKKDSSLNQPG